MRLFCDRDVITVVTMEHMVKNDFFLRLLEFQLDAGEELISLSYRLFSGEKLCCERVYSQTELASRMRWAREELARYRDSSLPRILGREEKPECAVMHEYFSVYTTSKLDTCQIVAVSNSMTCSAEVALREYHSENRYLFPMKGTYLVSDTYSSINSHRWCRNSEFAIDIGAFSQDLGMPVISGREVLAACEGIVEEVFDGLPDTTQTTDLDAVEMRFGEHARIDGNHVLIRHPGNEYTLYAHLLCGSIRVSEGDYVQAGQVIGQVGSSGSSSMPHLHFHAMRDGISGPGIPIRFENIVSFFEEDCALEETTNIIRTK